MPEIKIVINKEGTITIDASHPGDSCENSLILKKLTSILQTEGEIDDIQLKYNKQKTSQTNQKTQKIKIEEIF